MWLCPANQNMSVLLDSRSITRVCRWGDFAAQLHQLILTQPSSGALSEKEAGSVLLVTD